MPTRLERQLAAFERNSKLDVVSCWFSLIDTDSEEICQVAGVCRHEDIRKQIYDMTVTFPHGSVMMRKTAVEKVGLYDVSLSRIPVEDYDLWLRLCENGSEFYITPEHLYALRISPDSITGCIGGAHKERATLKACIRKARLEGYRLDDLLEQYRSRTSIEKLSERERNAYYYRIIGARKIDANKTSSGRSDLLRAIRGNPALVSAWYYLLLSILPLKGRRMVKRLVLPRFT